MKVNIKIYLIYHIKFRRYRPFVYFTLKDVEEAFNKIRRKFPEVEIRETEMPL